MVDQAIGPIAAQTFSTTHCLGSFHLKAAVISICKYTRRKLLRHEFLHLDRQFGACAHLHFCAKHEEVSDPQGLDSYSMCQKSGQRYGKGNGTTVPVLFKYRLSTLRVPFKYIPRTVQIPLKYCFVYL